MSVHISKRLFAVASLVPRNARVIDVGTDHAIVPVWLVQNAIAAHVWASDIREGPLLGAARLLRENGICDAVELRQTDGLQGFSRSHGDTVILAGMGGETMISVLTDAPWTREDTLLILEPQSKQGELRKWLFRNGYRIERELLVEDAGRIYPVFTVRGGVQEPAYSEAELYVGSVQALSREPLFPRWVDGFLSRIASAAPYDAESRRLYDELMNIKESLQCQL